MSARGTIDLERVVQVAVTLANAQGFEAVTLASVAEELGIRIPSLYNYIANLADLRRHMTLWGIRQIAAQMQRAAVGKAGDDAIYAVANAYRTFAHTNPGIYGVALRSAYANDPEIEAAAAEVLDTVVAIMSPYGFSGDEAIHAVRVVRSVLHGFVDLEAANGFGIPLSTDETFQRLMQMLIQGLHAQRST